MTKDDKSFYEHFYADIIFIGKKFTMINDLLNENGFRAKGHSH